MPSTPVLALPYPAGTDPANVPLDMQELADRIEAVRGATNGLASLDATTKVPATQLPSLAGLRLAHSEITANVTSTATAEASATTVVPGAAVTYDGAPVLFEFFSPFVSHSVAGAFVFLLLCEGATVLGRIGALQAAIAGSGAPVLGGFQGIPSAGAHTYSIKTYTNVAGTITVFAGGGGPGAYLPCYLRITKS